MNTEAQPAPDTPPAAPPNRCSDCDEDCETMTHRHVVECFLGFPHSDVPGWRNIGLPDGFCPFLQGAN